MYSRLISTLAVAAIAGASLASAAVIRGRVTDNAGEPMVGASVSLLRPDSTLIEGVSASGRGGFSFKKVAKGRYIVRTDYIGYSSAFNNIQVKSDADTLRLPTIKLAESSIMLKEAVAIGIATPIKVMEDTIQYAANAYKTPPNAVVEDLLKRLPGVEVDQSGGITAQGQKVTKILLDGEEFFADDPTVATKNLPVEIVENAQVITRKSDLARLTGVDDGEDETVINLTVKKGMKRGWNGTVEAGYGTDDRWLGRFIFIGMHDKNQFTVTGNFNNCNTPGFGNRGGGRFRGGAGNSGITTTESLGFDFTLANNEKLRFGGNAFYAHSQKDYTSSRHRINLLHGVSNSTEDSESASLTKSDNISTNLRLLWEPDSFNTMEFRPYFSYFLNHDASSSYSQNLNGTDPISRSRNITSSKGHGYDLSGRLIYSHKFSSHRGRTFSVSANYALSDTREDETAWSRNAFWQRDSIYEDYQLIDTHSWSNSVDGRLTWVEPIGNVKNGNFLEFSYSMNYRWNNADKDVLHQPLSLKPIPDTEEFEQWQYDIWRDWDMSNRMTGVNAADLLLDPDNTNHFRNDYFTQSLRIGYRKVAAKYNLNAGLSVNPSMSRSVNLTNSDKTIPTRWVWNYAPFVRFRYRFSKQTSANIFYNGRSSQPSLTQLQPVADTSDPMNIVIGNPALDPSFTHNLMLRYQTNDPDKQQSIIVMGRASLTQNAIASKMTYNLETGGRITSYENVNGNWNANVMTMYSRPLRNKAFTVNNFLRGEAMQQVGFTDGRKNTGTTLGFSESFGFKYTPHNMEFEIRPRYTLKSTTNSIQNGTDRTVHTYGGTLNASYYAPFGLVLATDLNYGNSTGYSAGFDAESWMWNASISYMFLRDKSATVALKGYDLLQQNKSISRSETAQAITDSRANTLSRYFMLTFTYKFNTMKKNGRGGDDLPGADNFGPGRGGMPPMGPPPGGHGGGPGRF